MVRKTENRDVRIGVGDFVGIDPPDVRDHEIRRVDAVDSDEVISGQQPFELAAKVEIDSRQQDRRHVDESNTEIPAHKGAVTASKPTLEQGLELIRGGEYFAAHEVLEDVWRAADEDERDFFQGLVHVTVAWYQAGRGRRVGCERQLVKAERRLRPYAPEHRGVNLERLLASVEAAAATARNGSLELAPPSL